MIYYSIKGKKFNEEERAISHWLELGDDRRYYSVFKRDTERPHVVTDLRLKVVTFDKVKEIYASHNDSWVEYNNVSRQYRYRNLDKINLDNLDTIICIDKRGMYGNISSAFRFEYVNNTWVCIS